MIIFGSRGRVIKGITLESSECPHCGNRSYSSFGIMRYFHIYWIPVFPLSRKVGVECLNCRRTLFDTEIPEKVRADVKGTVYTKKTMFPMFTGLFLIACLVGGGYVTAQADARHQIAYMEHPQIHDVYVVDFTKIFKSADATYKYGVMRVKSITGESIELEVNNIAYDKTSGPSKDIRDRKIEQPNYFDSNTFTVSASQLQNLQSSGAIYSVERI